MGPVVVVEGDEVVELTLQLGLGAGERLAAEPSFEGLMEPLELSAGLGVPGCGADVAHAQGPQVPLERGFAVGEAAGEARAVVAHHVRR